MSFLYYFRINIILFSYQSVIFFLVYTKKYIDINLGVSFSFSSFFIWIQPTTVVPHGFGSVHTQTLAIK